MLYAHSHFFLFPGFPRPLRLFSFFSYPSRLRSRTWFPLSRPLCTRSLSCSAASALPSLLLRFFSLIFFPPSPFSSFSSVFLIPEFPEVNTPRWCSHPFGLRFSCAPRSPAGPRASRVLTAKCVICRLCKNPRDTPAHLMLPFPMLHFCRPSTRVQFSSHAFP